MPLFWTGLERTGAVNTYTRVFAATCPNNGVVIRYTLRIVTAGEMIPVEAIVAATEAIGSGYHEDIAARLHERFGGRQELVAEHHGVGITTVRE